MSDIEPYAIALTIAALALLGAIASNRVSERLGIPAPAIFLLAASVAADLVPTLGSLDIRTDQRIVTVALVLILFDGGMHIGWRRFRAAAGAIAWLGVAGTFVTAGALALAAHGLFGFDWKPALLIGAALAPTDPAVVFSVLGRREVSGRSGTLLEGESGANDPVGIALMVSLLGATGSGWSAVGHGAFEFVLQMVLGGVFGVLGGYALLWLMRHLPMPNEALYSLRTIAFALLIFGVTTACHGSGFLAVFLAGILVGDARAPYKREIERFAGAAASLGEIVAFTVLGLSIPISTALGDGRVWTGLGLAALLILLVRPLLVGAVLIPVRLRLGERAFVLWAGLKGAVPILLGTYVLAEGIAGGERIYSVIFVVVLVSVVVQGGPVPVLARLWKVPMRVIEPEPWALGMRFREQPEGLHRYLVAAGSAADGCSIADLDLGEDAWISMVSRRGRLVQVRGETVLRPGDEVLALAEDDADPGHLFRAP
ncbi:potassium/proton antiporter [Jatrophihabitans cynanchi]|uniref:Potassium/proton antiporter n=1 Tax=Jatrophihabitans cynanchi TaxID=2944128 RepID=A0ABY7K1I2_9ACTN|nr:potassium/proton antiporter [Jatrophihabitans sp. SB3-54]WAX58704.1 potassium/proton antiporter [Jatrophihabitans sp. SB3-54]